MKVNFPRNWSLDELQNARDVAEARYVAEEGPAAQSERFVETYLSVEPLVDAALRTTSDLLAVDGAALSDDRNVWQVLRFCCGPPISEENLWTFVGRKFSGALPSGVEIKTAEVLRSGFDRIRFPWIGRGGFPSAEERRTAVVATGMLLAQARFHTSNRGLAAQGQEGAVDSALRGAGYRFDASARSVDELQPGTFCREKTIFNKKCDVPVRLWDGRLLTLECKVSNTPKNSWKRLNQETVGKSATWREHLKDGVVTGCVLAGVFDTSSLVQAQDQGVWLFWQHDLDELASYVSNSA